VSPGDKYNKGGDNELLLEMMKNQDERVSRVEDDLREFSVMSNSVQRILASVDYQQKMLEDLKESLNKQAEDSKHVAERNMVQHQTQNTEIANIKTEIALLKLKSGWWGLVGGLIAFVALVVAGLFR